MAIASSKRCTVPVGCRLTGLWSKLRGSNFKRISFKRCARQARKSSSIRMSRNSVPSADMRLSHAGYLGARSRGRWCQTTSALEAYGIYAARLRGSLSRPMSTLFWHRHISSKAHAARGIGDLEGCKHLRRALDAEGGGRIAIDYPLITTYGTIREAAQRRALLSPLRDLPIDNLWLRVSGFGADASPIGVRRYVSAVADFHALDLPIVADCVGGLTGLAIVSFGTCGATAADRTARQAAKLRTGNDAMDSALARASIRLDRMRGVLEDLYRTIGDEYSRSASPQRRLNPSRRASGHAD